ncbi:flagellar motor protein MotB [Xylophilus ampelinus]|uniref:Chemotaxis protein MotB n=1 Tax=Xylophilus ampelinus TaxID=54067 RepID=A0A318SJU2_9BURK|nr:flagellar motor protein MotB [Xylophilus ampelinus]MCS4511212.1 flagellar motor protein MotB [Xylophilus ampelinus]PYE75033.1 chemotaxis protein MotB [Xylophilus ampelinus]
MADKKLQPIIVKRIKKQGHAAHGGAWKIAYADFVTAMMAFFLLMWLLGSTAKGELQGIAAYFNSPLQVAMAGGNGAGNSSSIIPGGGNDLSKVHGQVRRSDSDADKKSRISPEAAKAEVAKQDAKRMQALQAKIESLITESPKLKEYKSQIRMEITPDGLQIQIVDDQNRPMFDSGSALVKPYMRDILREVGAALNNVENRVSLAGHTDASPYGNGDRGYSNWELSADRANASRRELVAAGMPDAKLVRVVGLAASDLMEPDKPNAPINRRISITVMTREAESRLLGNGHKSTPAAAEIADVIQEADRFVAPVPVQGLPSAAPPVAAVADAARPADAAATPRAPAPSSAPPAR